MFAKCPHIEVDASKTEKLKGTVPSENREVLEKGLQVLEDNLSVSN